MNNNRKFLEVLNYVVNSDKLELITSFENQTIFSNYFNPSGNTIYLAYKEDYITNRIVNYTTYHEELETSDIYADLLSFLETIGFNLYENTRGIPDNIYINTLVKIQNIYENYLSHTQYKMVIDEANKLVFKFMEKPDAEYRVNRYIRKSFDTEKFSNLNIKNIIEIKFQDLPFLTTGNEDMIFMHNYLVWALLYKEEYPKILEYISLNYDYLFLKKETEDIYIKEMNFIKDNFHINEYKKDHYMLYTYHFLVDDGYNIFNTEVIDKTHIFNRMYGVYDDKFIINLAMNKDNIYSELKLDQSLNGVRNSSPRLRIYGNQTKIPVLIHKNKLTDEREILSNLKTYRKEFLETIIIKAKNEINNIDKKNIFKIYPILLKYVKLLVPINMHVNSDNKKYYSSTYFDENDKQLEDLLYFKIYSYIYEELFEDKFKDIMPDLLDCNRLSEIFLKVKVDVYHFNKEGRIESRGVVQKLDLAMLFDNKEYILIDNYKSTAWKKHAKAFMYQVIKEKNLTHNAFIIVHPKNKLEMLKLKPIESRFKKFEGLKSSIKEEFKDDLFDKKIKIHRPYLFLNVPEEIANRPVNLSKVPVYDKSYIIYYDYEKPIVEIENRPFKEFEEIDTEEVFNNSEVFIPFNKTHNIFYFMEEEYQLYKGNLYDHRFKTSIHIDENKHLINNTNLFRSIINFCKHLNFSVNIISMNNYNLLRHKHDKIIGIDDIFNNITDEKINEVLSMMVLMNDSIRDVLNIRDEDLYFLIFEIKKRNLKENFLNNTPDKLKLMVTQLFNINWNDLHKNDHLISRNNNWIMPDLYFKDKNKMAEEVYNATFDKHIFYEHFMQIFAKTIMG